MKIKSSILTAAFAVSLGVFAQADTAINITGATAFRAGTINSIIAGFGGAAACGIVHSNTAATTASAAGANAVSIRGTWPGVAGVTTIRCRFSGSTEGVRDLVGNGATPNDVFYYPDASIPAAGTITFLNQNSNPVGANVPLKPDVAFSDVQQTSTPSLAFTLGPADSRVGVVTFVFCKSQGSSANLSNVTDQAWKAVLTNTRGVPLNVFTGLSGDQSGRVLATGRNDGSGTRAVYMIEPGVGIATKVQQFKLGANGFNGVTSAGFTGDVVNFLQLWPANDAEDANNISNLWNTPTNGNGGYFSGSNVANLVLAKDTSSVRVLGPTGTDLSSSGSYVGTSAGNPRAVSVVACVGTSDGLTAITGGASVLSYNGVGITPVAVGVDPTGLVPTDRYKVTNGTYTLWSYERMYNRGTLTADQDLVLYSAATNLKASIAANLGNAGIALSAMTAVRSNDGETVTQP